MRTSRKGFLRQITQIERRQARIRRIRSHLQSSHVESDSDMDGNISDTDTSMVDPTVRYHIGKTQNHPEHILSFIQKNETDPAIKASRDSVTKELKGHTNHLCIEFSPDPQTAPP